MKQINFSNVRINGGFWKERQDKVREKTFWEVFKHLSKTGRISTLDCSWKEGDPIKPHIFWGSDVFKWLEGAAYLLAEKKDEEIISIVDDVLKKIEAGVSEDGYYNSYYNSVDEPRFTRRGFHELYSLGHMIEAGIALDRFAGDDRLLKIAIKNADLVDRIFRIEDSAAFVTPGHEEIELALYKLYKYTNEERYLLLMKYFIDKRGNNDKDEIAEDQNDSQDSRPLREESEALGHAVRAVYLYSAMADLAAETDDKELMDATNRIFDDIYHRKMYITGGIGSNYQAERFTVPFDLPNRDAYTETCAALGLALFAGRLSNIKPDGRYGDALERAIYNGMMSGLSLDGVHFFYSNPLAIDLSTKPITKIYQPVTERQVYFWCGCCPPNLVRMIPSIGNMIYGYDDGCVYVHQYIANTASFEGIEAEIKTEYPKDGKVSVRTTAKKIALRKPAWCRNVITSEKYDETDGYLYFNSGSVDVEFEMKPVFYSADSRVHADTNRVAVMRGPIVYCMEAKDQSGDFYSISIDPTKPASVKDEMFGGYPLLECDGFIRNEHSGIYYDYSENTYSETKVKLIPFYTFANRGEDEMQVWAPVMHTL